MHDGVTKVTNGEFVSFDEAGRGFKFTPAEGFVGTASFKLQASTSASDTGLGGEVVTADITVLEALGTNDTDRLLIEASADKDNLEIYRTSGNAKTLIFTWPVAATVPLPINLLAGDDILVVELPDDVTGPAGGMLLDAGTGNNLFHMGGGRAHR